MSPPRRRGGGSAIPAVIAGLLVAPAGLLGTFLGYGAVVIATVTLGLFAQYRIGGRHWPGPREASTRHPASTRTRQRVTTS
ncbi:hypothetical protein CG719_24170 [Streptomyces sp. CB01373]|nr:hypothetical protein CG719_24170 [Streptomyces sp. CB01373]